MSKRRPKVDMKYLTELNKYLNHMFEEALLLSKYPEPEILTKEDLYEEGWAIWEQEDNKEGTEFAFKNYSDDPNVWADMRNILGILAERRVELHNRRAIFTVVHTYLKHKNE